MATGALWGPRPPEGAVTHTPVITNSAVSIPTVVIPTTTDFHRSLQDYSYKTTILQEYSYKNGTFLGEYSTITILTDFSDFLARIESCQLIYVYT